MKILVEYATTEGQTRKIAKFVASKLSDLGHEVTRRDLSDHMSGSSVDEFDKVVLAGSVHESRHQEALGIFIAAHKCALDAKTTLFLSVSLSAAFENTIGEAEGYVARLCEELDWHPDKSLLVAGAINHATYGYYQEMILQHEILPERPVEHPEEDHEFTDWDSLEKAIAEFAGE